MKQLFHIQNTYSASGQELLLIRIGTRHLSFCTSNKAGTVIHELVYLTEENAAGWTKDSLDNVLSSYPLLKETYYQALIAFDLSSGMLMPVAAFRQEDGAGIIGSLYGSSAAFTVTEAIPEWQLVNVYQLPADIKEWASAHFPAARQMHQYSLGIKQLVAREEAGCINLDIRSDDFTVMAAKQGKFLLAQTHEYANPEDVVYQLLRITENLSLSQQETTLFISGLVDKQSALYRELYQYFIKPDFRDALWNTDGYPAHFFTSLNDLARCAS